MEIGDGNESPLLRDLTGLQNSNSLAVFLEVAFDAVVAFDPQERITSWNPAAEQMFGWTSEEALGKTSAELFWPVDMPLEQGDKKQRRVKLKQGEALRGQLIACRKDGSSFPAQFTARATFDGDGEICGYLAVYRDISAQVQALEKEKQLQQSNQRLNEILSSIQDDFYVLNRDWVFVFTSRSFTSKIGKEPEDFVGNNIWQMFPKHIGGVLYQNFHAAMENREIRRFEIPGRYTDAWYRMTAFPSPEGITVLGTDITERKHAEDALRESEERFSKAFHASPVGINIFNLADGRSIDVNEAFLALTGFSRDEFIGSTGAELGLFVNLQEREDWIQALNLKGAVRNLEVQFRHKSGNILHTLFSIVRIEIQGEAKGLVLAVDITERKHAEEALRESEKQLQQLNESLEQKVQEKTEEVRHLASDLTKAVQRERHRISHILHDDLQQRIYAIQMQLAFLRYELEEGDEPAKNEMSEIESQLAEILEITRHLSIDLSPPILQNEGLAHAISWLAGQMRQRYGLPIDLVAEEDFVIPNEELQVLLFNCVRELLFNVVKHAKASRAVVALHWLKGGLQIDVRDDGKGFQAGTLEKAEGSEAGREESMQSSFGLPTIRQQLSLFGGRMEVHSQPGIETKITLMIPIVEGG